MDYKTKDQIQFKLGGKLGLDKTDLSNLALKSANQAKDKEFSNLIGFIEPELK